MNREQARKYWQIIKAYGEGKDLQYRRIGEDKWNDERKGLGFCFDTDDCEFRIKPEECMSAWKDEPQPETTLTTTDHSCNCRGCKYIALESVDEPCCDCSDNSKYEKVEEKKYRPFEDTTELMLHYSKHFNVDYPPFYEPIIWVKRKDNDSRFLITGYDELDVFLEGCYQDLNDLYEQYVFLDGSCIGKEEVNE